MPLIVLVGCPASGKSTRAAEIKEYFETQYEKKVFVISENEIIKNSGIPKVSEEKLKVLKEVKIWYRIATLKVLF